MCCVVLDKPTRVQPDKCAYSRFKQGKKTRGLLLEMPLDSLREQKKGGRLRFKKSAEN